MNKKGINKKMSLEGKQVQLNEKYPDYDFTLLEYNGQKGPMTIKCNACNWQNTYKHGSNFDRNGRKRVCPRCDGSNKPRVTQEEAQERIDDIFGKDEYKIIRFKKASDKLMLKHKCGFCFTKTSLYNMTKSMGCPKCKTFASKGEAFIASLLIKWSVPFASQYKVPGLIGESSKGLLRFDFCIDDYLMIEFDGEGHYRGFNGDADYLKIQQKNDEKKNQYCKENGFPLLRIPYWKATKIPKLIHDFLTLNDYPFGEYDPSGLETLDISNDEDIV